jgi:hypothetical protein
MSPGSRQSWWKQVGAKQEGKGRAKRAGISQGLQLASAQLPPGLPASCISRSSPQDGPAARRTRSGSRRRADDASPSMQPRTSRAAGSSSGAAFALRGRDVEVKKTPRRLHF